MDNAKTTDKSNSKEIFSLIDKKEFLFLLFMFGLLFLKNPGVIIALSIIIINIFRKKEWLLKGLLYAFFLRYSNTVLFEFQSTIINIGSYMVLFICFFYSLHTFLKKKYKIKIYIYYLSLFVIYVLILSPNSPLPSISIFKILSFSIGFFTVYMAYEINKEYDWIKFLNTVFIFYTISSLPLFFIKSLGFARIQISFQGITSQPQFFGVFLSTLIPLYILQILKIKNMINYNTIIIIMSLIWIYTTHARTAILAICLALIFYFLISAITKLEKTLYYILEFLTSPKLVILLILIIFIGLSKDYITKNIIIFLNKDYYQKKENYNYKLDYKKLTVTRTKIIIPSWNRFLENPIWGNGFGVASDYNTQSFTVIPYFDIPISAPTEKGNIVTALLEETGLVGFILFSIFLINMALPVIKSLELTRFLLFFTAFFLNLGEMTFFSANGMGIYIWFLMILATSGENIL